MSGNLTVLLIKLLLISGHFDLSKQGVNTGSADKTYYDLTLFSVKAIPVSQHAHAVFK